jgi:hypothetical protein
VRDLRHAATGRRGWNHEDERRTRDRGKTERFCCCGDEYVRRHNPALVVLMIGTRSRTRRNHGIVAGQVRVHRLAVMMTSLARAEMYVRQRSGDRSGVYEHDEHGGGQPAKHGAIVVNLPHGGT